MVRCAMISEIMSVCMNVSRLRTSVPGKGSLRRRRRGGLSEIMSACMDVIHRGLCVLGKGSSTTIGPILPFASRAACHC